MALTITLKVVPSSGKSACLMGKNGMVRCYLKSAPEKGKANKELIKLLAKLLGLPQSDIAIVRGETERTKVIRVAADISHEQFLQKLGIELQMNIFE